MKPNVTKPRIIGLTFALLFAGATLLTTNVTMAHAQEEETVSTDRAFPASTLNCSPNQIPTYDGTDLVCGKMDSLLASTYEIAPVGQLIGDLWGLEYVYQVAGGTLNSRTGKGEMVLGQGLTAEITYAYVTPEFVALKIEFGVFGSAPTAFTGILDATSPGSQIYEGDLVDEFGNEITFDFPGIQLF